MAITTTASPHKPVLLIHTHNVHFDKNPSGAVVFFCFPRQRWGEPPPCKRRRGLEGELGGGGIAHFISIKVNLLREEALRMHNKVFLFLAFPGFFFCRELLWEGFCLRKC